MSIYTRIYGTEEPRIAVHTFVAACAEYARGIITGPQALAMFTLSAAEQTEVTTLIGRVQSNAVKREEVEDALILLENKLRTVAQTKTRLGV